MRKATRGEQSFCTLVGFYNLEDEASFNEAFLYPVPQLLAQFLFPLDEAAELQTEELQLPAAIAYSALSVCNIPRLQAACLRSAHSQNYTSQCSLHGTWCSVFRGRGEQLLPCCSNFSDPVLDPAPAELELTPAWKRPIESSSILCARRARKYAASTRLQLLTSGTPKPSTPLLGNLKIETLATKGPNLQDPKPAYTLTSRISQTFDLDIW